MTFDVIVVGGGHAGIEAVFACLRKKLQVLLITLDLDNIAAMPCNPSIGGSAKGIVVREIDALGGMMGHFADDEYLQMKMLNTSKGPGVRCLRAQNDKDHYKEVVKRALNAESHLKIIADEVIKILVDDEIIHGVETKNHEQITAKAVILATGTYLSSTVIIGHETLREGPDGQKSADSLSSSLMEHGINLARFKTGTPPRIYKDSIDYQKISIELGTNESLAFSYATKEFVPFEKQLPCYLTYTTMATHQIILDNLDSTGLFSGIIKGIGPRYCPSIESKVVQFNDKERHQLFVEPERRFGDTIYLQGFSTSMKKELQEQMVKSVIGFEKARIKKYAYAIEYDALKSGEFDYTLESKKIANLFFAGQICGTSGYEEAAGLGLVAGINAANKILGLEPLILMRNESYIGVMIDDLVLKGTDEPYRLLSSRAEFRLHLRHDNADLRLREIGYRQGLIDETTYQGFLERIKNIKTIETDFETQHVGKNSAINVLLESKGYPRLTRGYTLKEIIKRPNIDIFEILTALGLDLIYPSNDYESAAIHMKYEGYLKLQEQSINELLKLENMKIPIDFDFNAAATLSLEARQKLMKVMPRTIGQASRISGISNNDLANLVLLIKRGKTSV
ncbi:MAG: tRNA uridine-5-carboxymethylaminomethyl(34) synthesis enzyme MnmG [Erysipelotrichaceae bacterium]|jgi:tRNA uridine 5-carboxymethylaminomethyl modification enzyme|nr:tRNA uridine-5-carboxymethylaminomethyl(34) synthesis enzyme MnmG [Erysipelotrichaceae bacterium]